MSASSNESESKVGKEDPPEQPMKVEKSSSSSSLLDVDDSSRSWTSRWCGWMCGNKRGGLPRYQKMVTEENARKNSLGALRYAVVANSVNIKILNPNYAIMCIPGLTEDSFDNTEPFSFNSATYFLPLCSLLGVAITSIFAGQISDKKGRKKVIWFCSIMSGFASIGKYFARNSFWGFCLASFVGGLFGATLPVAMAYAGDIYTSKKEKEKELGVLVGYHVMGNSGGGAIAIIMESTGLFTPLWVGAGMMFVAAAVTTRLLIEPGDARLLPIGKVDHLKEWEEEEEKRPETIDKGTMWNIVGGALADNIGSNGLFPLCLSPLALEQYFRDFIEVGQEPIMTITGYKWLTVCVAAMVVPGTVLTPYIFSKIGPAGGCVMGNLMTALITMALLLIAGYGPATTAAFAGFVTVLYAGYPMTVISQLSTGPMLDVLAPEDKIGYVQGLNNSTMNFGMAFAPWLFGLLADGVGTNPAIWTAIGVSLLASLINTPLIWKKGLGKPEKRIPAWSRALPGEDKDLIEKALNGEFVPPSALAALNKQRAANGQPAIVPKIKTYEEDKESLQTLFVQGQATFHYRKERADQILKAYAEPAYEDDIEKLCGMVNSTLRADQATVDEVHRDLGKWFADYLQDNGYFPHVQSLAVKQMILAAFPTITHDKEVTPENIEQVLLNNRRVSNQYLALHEEEEMTLSKLLGNGSIKVHW